MLVSTSSFPLLMGMSLVRIPKLACHADEIFPTQRRQHEHSPMGSLLISLQVVKILCCGSYPARSPYYAAGIFSSRSPSSQLHWWDFPHSEATMNPTLLLEFLSLEGLPLLEENTTYWPRHFTTNRPYRKKKSSALKRYDRTWYEPGKILI